MDVIRHGRLIVSFLLIVLIAESGFIFSQSNSAEFGVINTVKTKLTMPNQYQITTINNDQFEVGTLQIKLVQPVAGRSYLVRESRIISRKEVSLSKAYAIFASDLVYLCMLLVISFHMLTKKVNSLSTNYFVLNLCFIFSWEYFYRGLFSALHF